MITSISGGFIVSASLREALPGNAKKRLKVRTNMVLLHTYSKSLSVRSPVCLVNKNKVLIPIKLLVVYVVEHFDSY